MTVTPNAQPINVLLIEDNPVDIRLVTELLHDTPRYRFHVITASTLSQGLALLSTNSVDVILLDLGLPDSQGLDTFHAVYKQASHLPIIVLTVSDDEALGQRVLQEGAQRFLSKDVLTLGPPYAGIFTRMIRFSVEHKRAEAALAESEEHYRELVNNLDALILWVNPTLHITFANQYALTLLGYTAEEFVGRHVIGTLLPSTESTGRDLEQMADDIISRPSDYRHNRNEVITKDGRRLWIEWTNTPQHNEEGTYTGVLSTGVDITERVAIEQELKTSKEHFQSLFNSSAIAQVYYDATGYPVRANQATLALFGIADVSALQHMAIFSSPRMTDDDKAQLRAGQSVEYEQRYDFDAIKASGSFETTNIGKRYVHVFFTPLLDTKTGSIDGYLGQITDITDRTRAEHLLQEAHQDVQALNEQLQFTNAQLRTVNEALEERVQKRTEELTATTASLKKEVAVRKRAETTIKRRVRELEVMNEIVMIGSTARDLPSLLSQILTKALAFIDLEVGHVRLLHDNKLTLECSHGLPSQYVEEQREIPISDPLFDPVLHSGKPRFEEAFEDIDSARARGSALKTAGAIPLLSGRKVIGVLGFGSRQRRRLSKEQKGLLELIGREAGTVIAKMQAQQALTHELAITETITRLAPQLLFPSLDLDGLMLAILKDAKRLTGSAQGFIALIDPHTKDVISYGHTQMALDERAIPEAQRQVRFSIGSDGRYQGLWGHALNERQGFFTNAPAQHPAAAGNPEGHAGLEQFLAVPAFVSDEVVGEITLANPGRPYTRHDVAVVRRLAEELFSLAVMRMQEEEQVRASSLYTRSLIEASLDPLVTINAEGTITDVNTATEDVIGCSRDELIGSDFSDYFTEPDKADTGYRQVFTEGFVRDYPLAIRHKSGKVTDVLYNATVYRNETGEIQGVFAAARDVTELKQAEEATRAHAHRASILTHIITAGNQADSLKTAAQAMLDAAMDLMQVTHGSLYLLNEAEGMLELQYARGFNEEVLDASHRFPPTTSYYPRVYAGTPVFLDDYATQGTQQFRGMIPELHAMAIVPLVAQNRVVGNYIVSSARTRPFTDEERDLLAAIGQQAGTVIARLQAEERVKEYSRHLEDLVTERTALLAKSEEEFRTLFEASSIAQIRYDADGHALRMNKAAAVLFGVHDVSDIRDRNMFSSVQASQKEKARLREGRPLHCEQVYDFRAIKEGGLYPTTRSDVRYFDLYVLPLTSTLSETVEGYLAQIVDITELKEAEAALKNAERLAGIGETAAMIGHDLRNPLQGLQYIVDLQKLRFDRLSNQDRRSKDWEQEAQLFDRISEQIYYMDKIVADLQDYARPLNPEREALSVRILIDDVLQSLPHADTVEVDADLPDLTIEAEPHLMHRLFSNLFLNALQAMPDGGTLTVSAVPLDGSVAISVRDTGIGIPHEMRDKLFSPLATGKAKGTGLGLAVVKRIVDAHGGSIEFESEEGEGTTFTLTLPCRS